MKINVYTNIGLRSIAHSFRRGGNKMPLSRPSSQGKSAQRQQFGDKHAPASDSEFLKFCSPFVFCRGWKVSLCSPSAVEQVRPTRGMGSWNLYHCRFLCILEISIFYTFYQPLWPRVIIIAIKLKVTVLLWREVKVSEGFLLGKRRSVRSIFSSFTLALLISCVRVS